MGEETTATLPVLPDIDPAAPWPTLAVPLADRPELGQGALYWQPMANDNGPDALIQAERHLYTLPRQKSRPEAAPGILVYHSEDKDHQAPTSVSIGAATPAVWDPVGYRAEASPSRAPAPITRPVPTARVPAMPIVQQPPLAVRPTVSVSRSPRSRGGSAATMGRIGIIFGIFFGFKLLGGIWAGIHLLLVAVLLPAWLLPAANLIGSLLLIFLLLLALRIGRRIMRARRVIRT